LCELPSRVRSPGALTSHVAVALRLTERDAELVLGEPVYVSGGVALDAPALGQWGDLERVEAEGVDQRGDGGDRFGIVVCDDRRPAPGVPAGPPA